MVRLSLSWMVIAVQLLWAFHAAGQFPAAAIDARLVWTPVENLPNDRPLAAQGVRAQRFKALRLNLAEMRRQLQQAPQESNLSVRRSSTIISLPMPDGSFERFRFVESPVMATELSSRYPEIRTYLGDGIDDTNATVRFDLTPAGFHAQILSPSGTVYVDPAFRGESEFHTSYYKRDYARAGDDFRCLLEQNATAGRSTTAVPGSGGALNLALERSGGNLRTYRLAVAATGEYTAYHGGTVSAGLAAIVTAVNRVTGIYEAELAIRLVLVANNDQVVYTSSATDPFSNNNPTSLLSQNQSTLDGIIGSGNYDVGHVFSTAGGGLAELGVVCIAGLKARGETGMSNPIGDAFYIDYVAHELGHQFGANHTFNSSSGSCGGGNRYGPTAYEPGSGSTIMAYAGICGSDNLQSHSDPYFHSISFDEIQGYVTTGSGAGCAVNTPTGNAAPNVAAGASYAIPQGTPFTLTASGSDPNGDPLTYCWEERDLGSATTVSAPDNGSSPLFRSWSPSASASRVFPRLQNLLNNTFAVGEVMPTTTRAMNFRVTARDNRNGGGGVSTADMQVTVTAAAGPFVVTSHNSGGAFSGIQNVTWNVAGTTVAPVNTANVNILLSTDGGHTFPITLATNTPNDGSEIVLFPDVNTSTARLKVEAAGNIFFDVCNNDFTITPAIPTPFVTVASVALVSENCVASNNMVDPDESVVLSVSLKNIGTADTTNLVATVLLTNGVTAASQPQDFGVLIAGGSPVARSFTLTAAGDCGGSFAVVLQLQDDGASLGTVSHAFNFGRIVSVTTTRSNTTPVTIPGGGTKGAASPFPASIAVSGMTGTVNKVTATLNAFSHTWPADVDVLLVGPGGQSVLLLSDAGGGTAVDRANLTFDDDAQGMLSDTTAITSGTYKPSNYGTGDTFSSPAPGGAYGSSLAVFKGLDANGTWSLFIQDDSSQDTGLLMQGWQLSITTSNAACCSSSPTVTELAMGGVVSSTLLNVGSNLTFILSLTNLGPDAATHVLVSDVLPPGTTFLAADASQGFITNSAGLLNWWPGELLSNGVATLAIQVVAETAGRWTNSATVTAGSLDPISTNNFTSAEFAVNAFPYLAGLQDLVVNEDTPVGPFTFTVGDLESPAGALVVNATASDASLIPPAGIVLGGSGSNRWISLAAAPDQSGAATIVIDVSDGQATSTGSFLLTVLPVNDPPVLKPIPDFVITEGDSLVFTNFATDVDSPPAGLSFSLLHAPLTAYVDPVSGVFTWNSEEADGPGTNLISIVVNDDGSPSLSATQSFTVIVLETNSAPQLTPLSDITLFEGETLAFTCVATDPDWPQNKLFFSALDSPSNALLDPTNGMFSWTPDEWQGPGTSTISIVVQDNGSPSLSATQTFTVTVLESNQPPVLAPIADQKIHAGITLTVTNTAEDFDWPSNRLSFSLAPDAPVAASIGEHDGILTWQPVDKDANRIQSITVRVTDDGSPPLSVTQTFLVTVASRPDITGIEVTDDRVILAWTTLAGNNYALQVCTNVAGAEWFDLAPLFHADGPSCRATNLFDPGELNLFRVRVVP